MAKKPTESTGETTKPEVGELVPQPHGGALRYGGTNKGGPGRPPTAIRRHLRGSFDERIEVLERIADGTIEANPGERIRALKLMAEIGFGPQVSTEDVRERIRDTLDIVEQHCDQETAEKIIRALRGVWRDGR